MIEFIIDGLGGWRYLISANFRKRTHERWKAKGRAWASLEIALGSIGVIFTLFLVWTLLSLVIGR
jgi:hypothetical protein